MGLSYADVTGASENESGQALFDGSEKENRPASSDAVEPAEDVSSDAAANGVSAGDDSPTVGEAGPKSNFSSGSEPGETDQPFFPGEDDTTEVDGRGGTLVEGEKVALKRNDQREGGATAYDRDREEGAAPRAHDAEGVRDKGAISATSDNKQDGSPNDTEQQEGSSTGASITPNTFHTAAFADGEAPKALDALSEAQADIVENTERLAERLEREKPHDGEVAAALRAAAAVLQDTVEKLRASREAYLEDHGRVMEVLQRYARARELLDAGIQCATADRVDLRNRLTAARDAFKALFVLVSTAERRAESVRALTEALAEAQSNTLAAVLNLARGSAQESTDAADGARSLKTQANLEEVRRAVYNMSDLAAAVEHTTRATVDVRAKQSEELGLTLIRRFETLGDRRDTTSAAEATKPTEATEESKNDSKPPRSHEKVLEELEKRTGKEPGVRQDIVAAKRAGEALMQELAIDAMKTMQHVAEGTADTLEEALHARVLGQAENKYRASIIVLGVLLCVAILALLALIIHAILTLVSFHSKFNAARMGEQTGQAHIDDMSPRVQ